MNSAAATSEAQRSDAPRITVVIDRLTLERLDQLVMRVGQCSRSAIVRLAIRELFNRLTAGDPGTESR